MVEHADFFVEAQRVVERQYVDKRAQPDGACALYRACQKYAWARRHSEWGRVVLGKMIAVEPRPFDQFEKTQNAPRKSGPMGRRPCRDGRRLRNSARRQLRDAATKCR